LESLSLAWLQELFDLAALERELKRLGGSPAIVIANAGEVNAGHFDPIAEMGDLAHEHSAGCTSTAPSGSSRAFRPGRPPSQQVSSEPTP
jgi:hypothetical protein